MKNLIIGLGIGAFGYACWYIGRVYEIVEFGTIYREAELGDEESIELMEKAAVLANEFNENLTKIKKQIRE